MTTNNDYGRLAQDIAEICRAAQAKQARFMRERNLTLADIKAMPTARLIELNREYKERP